MRGKKLRPSAALIVAVLALFVALGGTAGAVVTRRSRSPSERFRRTTQRS